MLILIGGLQQCETNNIFDVFRISGKKPKNNIFVVLIEV
jgi:hypothetical protein|tara:strand:- start:186154 stop:186270 length:117 start_codon:yes stop_codon:yes gene_type:complete